MEASHEPYALCNIRAASGRDLPADSMLALAMILPDGGPFDERLATRWNGARAVAGCGVAALPCRVTAAAVVPAVGHPVASPVNACADAIDPGG